MAGMEGSNNKGHQELLKTLRQNLEEIEHLPDQAAVETNLPSILRFMAALRQAEMSVYGGLLKRAARLHPNVAGYSRFLEDLARLQQTIGEIEPTVLDAGTFVQAREVADDNLRFTMALDTVIECAVDLLSFDNPDSERADLSEGYSFDSKNIGFKRGWFNPLAGLHSEDQEG